jgi:YacP-like NYN domain
VVVVFDSGRESTVPSEPSPHPMLSVRFSTPPDDADAAILALLAGAKKDPSVTVVTADSELSFQARKLGASVVPPDGWEPLKGKTAKKARKQRKAVTKDDKPQASAKDVDYWLGVFGDGSSEDK